MGAGSLVSPTEGSSSAGRASVSKTDGRGFESLLPCPSSPLVSNAMSMDMNREQKRQLRKMGALDEKGQPTRAPRQAPARKPEDGRTSLPQYLREVRSELRKVAWPTWPEVRKYSVVVLITVMFFMAYVGGLDYVFGLFSSWLYG